MGYTINPRSGLRESVYERLNIPHVQQTSVRALRLNGQKRAVHTVPLQNGLTLDFYADLGVSDELVVTFHGAMPRTLKDYPWFARIRSVAPKTKAMLAIADPTLQVDPKREMLASWYLGNPGWDPIYDILHLIRKAQGKTGAKYVAFIGGSGGAIPALRASALLPGSLAFIQDPRVTFSEMNHHIERYFAKAWPGWDPQKMVSSFPSLFDMAAYYRDVQPKNFLYCTQNVLDQKYYESQFLPFAKALGVNGGLGISSNGRYEFMGYQGEKEGHGKITSQEFHKFYAAAFSGWRDRR